MPNKFKFAEEFTRNGGAYNRGSADYYYHRPFDPHYYVGYQFQSDRVEITDKDSIEYKAYTAGYEEHPQGQKDFV